MQPQYETSRLLLSVSHPDKAAGVLEFYERNRDFLEPYEPVKRPGFYSPDFQRTNLTFEYNSFVKARHLRMWMYLRRTEPTFPSVRSVSAIFCTVHFQAVCLATRPTRIICSRAT